MESLHEVVLVRRRNFLVKDEMTTSRYYLYSILNILFIEEVCL